MVYKKFEKIRYRIIQGRKLQAFPTANVLQDHEDRLKALEDAIGSDGDNGEGGNSNSGGSQGQTPTTRDLSFTVTNLASNDPIEGATVTIGEKSGTTGSAGGCTVSGIEEGTHSVEVSATGYTTKTESITVDETHTSFTISLNPSQDIP